jgi:hypothetical protein
MLASARYEAAAVAPVLESKGHAGASDYIAASSVVCTVRKIGPGNTFDPNPKVL